MSKKLIDYYLRMSSSKFNRNWKQEVYWTLKFTKRFDETADKKQMEFLVMLYENKLWQKKFLFLISETIIKDD